MCRLQRCAVQFEDRSSGTRGTGLVFSVGPLGGQSKRCAIHVEFGYFFTNGRIAYPTSLVANVFLGNVGETRSCLRGARTAAQAANARAFKLQQTLANSPTLIEIANQVFLGSDGIVEECLAEWG